jgi:hypothetical protein
VRRFADIRIALLAVTIPLCAQPSVRVYSELARINPLGEVTAPENPREILSPALARNAFTSFQMVVDVPKGTHYELEVGQNPADAVRVTVYREIGDRLEPAEPPYQGDATQVFWMDVWTDRAAPVRRIKIEPELRVNEDWIIYPMEGRVMDAVVPEGPWPEGSTGPADVMKSFLCGTKLETAAPGASALARLRFRNAQQDVALARKTPQEPVQKLAGACGTPAPADPEWYLRIRDYLFRVR